MKSKINFAIIIFAFSIFSAISFSQSELSLSYNILILEKEIYPNSYATLNLILQNPTNSQIKSISIIFETEDNNIQVIPSSLELDVLEAKTSFTQNFLMKIGQNAKTSNIRMYVTYYINSDKKSFYLNIPIKIIRFPIIYFSKISFSNDYLEIGKNVTLTIDITNNGYSAAKDVRIRVLPNDFILSSPNEILLKELKVGETKTISFNLYSSPILQSGYYNLPIMLVYADEEYTRIFNETKYISVKVYGKPKLEIFVDEISGSTATLKIVNSGSGKAKNVLIKYLNNTYFIDVINPGDYDTFDVNLIRYIEMNVSYLDDFNERFEETKIVRIESQFNRTSTQIPRQIQRVNNITSNLNFVYLAIGIVAIAIIALVILKKKSKSKKK